MLSTPPAFNLSQNQTLQFKSVAKISVGRKSESQSSFPFAIHLSMNHTDSLGAKQLFTPLRFRCQQVFSFRESFFRGPVGATRWREGDLCLIFKPASRTFLPSGKISFSRRPFGRGQLVGANGFMRLFDPTVKHFSAKIEKMFSDRQKGASASWITYFQSARRDNSALCKKCKAFHIIFYAI